MGRGKAPMELIPHQKLRCSTFHKRKRGLMKKLEEFTTLCDVQACMIVYGPHHDDGRPLELDVWPPDPSKVEKVIKRYHSKGPDQKPRQIQDLRFFFEKRKEKVNEDIVKMRRANTKSKYPGWDDRIDFASVDELYQFLETIDNRIYCADVYSELLKDNQRALMMKNGALSTQNNVMLDNVLQGGGLYGTNLPLEVMSNHMLDTNAGEFYCQSVTQRPFDFNPMPDPTQTMMMLMNDEYQYGSSSNASPMFYDQTAGYFENVMYSNNNNNMSTQQEVQQHQQQCMQRQINMNNNLLLMIPTNSSQLIENYSEL